VVWYNEEEMELPISLPGIVVGGQKRGKSLGFPTINFKVTPNTPEGIYVSRIEIEGKLYNALTFIGSAKTYNETIYQSETYVFDFDRDIYGEEVLVTLLKKLRDNEKFVSEEKLIEQMEEDKKKAVEYFERCQRL
jgi:riboflavin kinase/FMN adenylyltransferase